MFGWGKRREGFEWREHVRTTILVRRAGRQRRIEDARAAAIDAIKAKRDRGVEVGRARIESAAGAATNSISSASSLAARTAAGMIMTVGAILCAPAAALLRAVKGVRLPKFDMQVPPAIDRARGYVAGTAIGFAQLISLRPRHLAYGAAALGLVYGIGPMLRGDLPSAPGVVRLAASDAQAEVRPGLFKGRATALSGDMLQIGGQVIRLKGIEAPNGAQPCYKANGRRWSCGSAAETALLRLVRGKSVTCQSSSTDQSGHMIGECRTADTDIAAELVRTGKVFASAGTFAAYGREESEAQNARAGIWQGETLRPDAWREQVWEEAKRSAPEGCPIKGIVRASSRLYAMPWSNGYQGARVRESRGERWFCNENDARAAGFVLADRS